MLKLKTYDLDVVPDLETYLEGLRAVQPKMNDTDYRIFQAQYYAPAHTATATQIANSSGIATHGIVNLRYGRLGRWFCECTGLKLKLRPDDTAIWWSVWSIGYSTKGHGFIWEMRSQVAQALEVMGWVTTNLVLEHAYHQDMDFRTMESKMISEEERLQRISSAPTRPDAIQVLRTEYQRNADVVASVLFRADGKCELCGVDAPFKRTSNGEPYLEVHHIIPLSEGGEDTLQNTVALCPNCHRELHHGIEGERHKLLKSRVTSAPS